MGKEIEKLVEHLIKFQEDEFGEAYDVFYEWTKIYYSFIIDLTRGRAYEYESSLNMYLPRAEPNLAVIGRMLDHAHSVCSYSFRSAFIRGLIIGKGLEMHAEDIIAGMNASLWMDVPEKFSSPDERRAYYDQKSRDLLRFGIHYLERWEMYNNLFGENKPEET
jgi:hypothetical protein